jgi:hypothetical protein
MKTITIEKTAQICGLDDETFQICLNDRIWERWNVVAPQNILKLLEDDEKIGKIKVKIEIEVEA